jgi:hypothetical protein
MNARRTRTAFWALAVAICAVAALPASALAASGDEPAKGAAIGQVILATAGAATATLLLLGVGAAHRAGRTTVLGRISDFSERISTLPGWAAIPSALVAGSLLTALLGMYWDISLHIDDGRDPGPLANPAHYLILAGLFGVFGAGFLAMILPRGRPSATAIRLGRDWYAPLGGVVMFACGAFSLTGFPLDDVWHRLFGQDVTLWGPTHLMLLGGAAMALVGQGILLVEADRAVDGPARGERYFWERGLRMVAVSGAFLIGLSIFQAEFDFGVPQFRFIFQPMLIAIAAAVPLVMARVWGGPGIAIGAVLFFLAVRGLVSLVVGPVLGETLPHFPIYLASAVLVELVALWIPRDRPLALGAVAGLAVATVGLAVEWGWSELWMPTPWPSSLFPEIAVLAPIVGVSAGVIGGWIGESLRARPRPRTGAARLALPLAAVAIAGSIAYGLMTSPEQGVTARAKLEPARAEGGRAVNATFRIRPRDAANDAEWLNVTAWQGNRKLVLDPLERVGPGTYRTTEPIPVYGGWKSLLRLHSGDSLTAVPVFLPEDKAIPAKKVPASSSFKRPFVEDKKILQREATSNQPWLSVVAYGTVLAIALALLGLITWALVRLGREGREPTATEPAEPRRRAPRAARPVQPAG